MKQILIRVLAVLMMAVMLLTVVSCNNKKNDSTGTTPSGNNTVNPGDDPEETMNIPEGLTYEGEEFRILARTGKEYYSKELYYDEGITGSAVDSAVFRRMVRIEETYKVTTSMKTLSLGNIDTWMNVTSLTANLKETYHLVATHGRNCSNYVVSGLTADWNLLPYINLDASWWNQDAIEQWTAPSGSIYMMTGDMSYLSVGQAVGMFFNKTIINNVGLDMPYEQVRNDNWTFEVFRQYVTVTDNNLNGNDSGNITTDSFGYVTGWWRGPMNIIYSTDHRWVEVGSDTVTIISKSGNNLVNAFDDYFDLLFSSGACAMGGGDYDGMAKALEENRAAFYDDTVLSARSFKQKDINFGVVPMPKYDDSVNGYHTFVNADTNTFVIPRLVTSDEATAKMVSVVLENMAYYGQKQVLSTYYEDILTYNSLTDMDSVEMMGVIRAGLTYDLGYYYFPTGYICDIGYTMANERASRSFTTLYDALLTSSQSRLDKWIGLE